MSPNTRKDWGYGLVILSLLVWAQLPAFAQMGESESLTDRTLL